MTRLKNIHPLGELFHEVQAKAVFPDSKTFCDCLPKASFEEILEKYKQQKDLPYFDLKTFVNNNFELPKEYASDFESMAGRSVTVHIEHLWSILTRIPDREKSSIIPLPYPYVVPGGRFREIYYWDSYFTMLGLQTSGRTDMIQYMIDNFSYLIDSIGYIPNGNRSYFEGRSQPPFFSLMIRLLSEEKGKEILVKYLPQLEKEYLFWMHGTDKLNEKNNAAHRIVKMPNGSLLNRYWDENNTPRAEAYKEDIELANESADKEDIFRHIRAAAESGWDFSSRWFSTPDSFATIYTTDIIPVDLNSLLFHLEETLSEAYKISRDHALSSNYKMLAQKRKIAIQHYCWNEKKKFYFDYDYKRKKQTDAITAAAAFPLFFEIASSEQAEDVAQTFHSKLLKRGGIITTLHTTGQQWDAPNGWAPLQYIIIKGLENYGMLSLAHEIARRWISLNKKVYERTGKLMEKYNVIDTGLEAGGGEYPSQDGFGWTNGVLLKLMKDYERGKKNGKLISNGCI